MRGAPQRRFGVRFGCKTKRVAELPTSDAVKADLVEALTHEDDQWLWEPVWRLNTEYPDTPRAAQVGNFSDHLWGVSGDRRQGLVCEVVLGLESQHRVTLWQGQWPSGPTQPLSGENHQRILSEDAPWVDPEGTDLLVIIRP
jgi:hypothetical protein